MCQPENHFHRHFACTRVDFKISRGVSLELGYDSRAEFGSESFTGRKNSDLQWAQQKPLQTTAIAFRNCFMRIGVGDAIVLATRMQSCISLLRIATNVQPRICNNQREKTVVLLVSSTFGGLAAPSCRGTWGNTCRWPFKRCLHPNRSKCQRSKKAC